MPLLTNLTADFEKYNSNSVDEIIHWIQALPTPSNPTDLMKRIWETSNAVPDTEVDENTLESGMISANAVALICHDIALLLNYPASQLPEFIELHDHHYAFLELLHQFGNYLLSIEPIYPIPQEIYIISEKKPAFTALPASDHFPGLSRQKESLLENLLIILSDPLLETNDDEGYTRQSDQEAIKQELFKIANTNRHSFFTEHSRITRTPANTESLLNTKNIETFLRQLMSDHWMPEFFEMYYRYSTDPNQKTAFERMDQIIKDPNLLDFWVKTLHQEEDLAIYKEAPLFQRHRFKNQPEHQPDRRHPFDILAGEYYRLHANQRMTLTLMYFSAKNKIVYYQFSEALTILKDAVDAYSPKTKKDRTAKNTLLEQIDSLEKITDWEDAHSYDVLTTTLPVIEKTIASVLQYQYASLEAGIYFGDFYCNLYAQLEDIERLCLAGHEGKLLKVEKNLLNNEVLSPEITTLINDLLQRAESIRDLHLYPAYLLASKTYHEIAQAYVVVVKTLFSDLPQAFDTIKHYKNKVLRCYNLSLTMAYAAKQLESTGNYEAIAENISAIKDPLAPLLTINNVYYQSLTLFSEALKTELTRQWKELHHLTYRRIGTTSGGADPNPLLDEVNEIMKRHSVEERVDLQYSI